MDAYYTGQQLPESYEEFQEIKSPKFRVCCECHSRFTPDNTRDPLSWRATQIISTCGCCVEYFSMQHDNHE